MTAKSPVFFVAIALVASPTLAKDDIIARPKAYSDLVACRSIADAAQRLACFDSASERLEKATEAQDIVLLDRAEVKKAKRSLFGFSLPKLPFFGGDDEEEAEEFSKIESTFASVQSIGYGKWQFVIPDGGTWQTTDPVKSMLREGQKVTIKKSMAGGYNMQLSSSGGYIKVKRVG